MRALPKKRSGLASLRRKRRPQVWSNRGRGVCRLRWTSSADTGQNLVEVGQAPVDSKSFVGTCIRAEPGSGRFCANSGGIRARCGTPEFGPSCPDLGRTWPEVSRILQLPVPSGNFGLHSQNLHGPRSCTRAEQEYPIWVLSMEAHQNLQPRASGKCKTNAGNKSCNTRFASQKLTRKTLA